MMTARIVSGMFVEGVSRFVGTTNTRPVVIGLEVEGPHDIRFRLCELALA